MKKLLLLLTAIAAASMPAAAVHSRPSAIEEARIPFPSRGGIRNFRAAGDDVLYLQDRRRNWYRAELIGPCLGLRFARGLGFDTHGSSSFDRFSHVLFEGQRCAVASLVRSGPPPREGKKRKR